MPSVSVIMATCNHAKYIGEAIGSVLRQTFRDFELIVVDDGSTDKTLDAVRPLQKEHGFVVETQRNMGQAKAQNKGVALSRGEFIVPFDSDDIMMPDRLEKQVRHMAANPRLGMSGGNMLWIEANGRLARVQKLSPPRTLTFDDIYRRRKQQVWAPTMMMRRDALADAGGFHPGIYTDDFYITLKIASLGYGIEVMDDILAYYRAHGANISKNLGKMLEGCMATYRCFSEHPAYEQAVASYLHTYLRAAVRHDRRLAKQILRRMPFKHYRWRTLKALARTYLS